MALPRREQENMLRQAQGGDVQAFAELFESYRPMLTAVACRVVGPDACDDVVMETYLKAWRGLGKFGGRATISTWLCRIARNCAMDFRRRDGREAGRRVDAESPDGQTVLSRVPDETVRSPAEEAERRELFEEVQAAMEQLSDDHRTALLLREVDELSYRDIAAATDVSIGTVMSRLFHARRRLQKVLGRMQSCHA